MNNSDETEFNDQMSQLEHLLQQVDSITDPAARDLTGRIVQSLMDFHGAGLAGILERLGRAGEPGRRIMEDLVKDDLISHLFLLYDLHPQDLETRVAAALEKVRPYLGSHGGNVKLLEITDEGVVRIEMQGSCHSCPSSAITLKTSIEKAIYENAPDVSRIEVIELSHDKPESNGVPQGFVPIERLRVGRKEPLEQGVAP